MVIIPVGVMLSTCLSFESNSSDISRFMFNNRTAIAGAIIGLLLVFFYFVVLLRPFCYDHMTSQPLFVHSFMQFQLNCMCDVISRS